jgi:hypothetical protein
VTKDKCEFTYKGGQEGALGSIKNRKRCKGELGKTRGDNRIARCQRKHEEII